jgi:hypothetical protein
MNRGKQWLGNGVRLLTLVACALTLGVSVSRAQIVGPGGGIGGGPRGPIGGGIGGMGGGHQIIWRCSRCGHQVAPDAAVCSNCRARLGGRGGILTDEDFKSQWTTTSIVLAVAAGGIVFLLVAAGGIVLIVKNVKGKSKSGKWAKREPTGRSDGARC